MVKVGHAGIANSPHLGRQSIATPDPSALFERAHEEGISRAGSESPFVRLSNVSSENTMKSAAALIQSLSRGLAVDTALTSLPPYDLQYFARIPIIVYRASQELGWRFFPVPRFSCYVDRNLLINRATSHLYQLEAYARQHPDFALATGMGSGALGLVVDGKEGQSSILSLCGGDWDWLDTQLVRSATSFSPGPRVGGSVASSRSSDRA